MTPESNNPEFAKFLGRSPDTATADDVRRFQVHMTENGVRPSTLNSAAIIPWREMRRISPDV